MKNLFYPAILVILSLLTLWGCGSSSSKETPEPDITTLPQFDTTTPANQSYVRAVTNPGSSGSGSTGSAQVASTLTGKAGVCADQHGHAWSVSNPDPTLANADNKSQLGKYCGDSLRLYVSTVPNLERGKTYYVRPYATYGNNTVYGKTIQVRIDVALPSFPQPPYEMAFAEIPEVTASQIKISAIVDNNGGGEITQHGFIYLEGTSKDLLSEDGKFLAAEASADYKSLRLGPYTGALPGRYFGTITGLKSNTNYKVWAFIANAGGIKFWSRPMIFRTL